MRHGAAVQRTAAVLSLSGSAPSAAAAAAAAAAASCMFRMAVDPDAMQVRIGATARALTGSAHAATRTCRVEVSGRDVCACAEPIVILASYDALPVVHFYESSGVPLAVVRVEHDCTARQGLRPVLVWTKD